MWIKKYSGIWGYDKETIATEDSAAGKKVTTTIEHQPGKTLWDWLNFLVALAIPIAIAVGTTWFSYQQSHTSQQIATDQQEQSLLQTYEDRIIDLLLGNNIGKNSPTLANANPTDEISKAARARTLTTLKKLDPERKGLLLRFLYETKLISKSNLIIDLDGSDLSKADLHGIDLTGVNLNHVDLTEADLQDTNLSQASLSGTNLSGANLRNANFSKASLVPFIINRPDQKFIFSTLLVNTNLYLANFSGANLEGVFFNGANLIAARFVDANLSRADFHGAKYNAKFIQETDAQGQLVSDEQGKSIMLPPTYWDTGFNPRDAGAICVDC